MAERIPDSGDGAIIGLLRSAQGRDEKALNRLLTATHSVVADFLRRRGGSESLRGFEDDVCIEVLVRVVHHLDSCRAGTDREYWRWVLAIARNEALRYLSSTYFLRAEVLRPDDLERLAVDREGEETVDALAPLLVELVGELPEARQELLAWRFVEKLEYAEIAGRAGTTEAAAKRRVQRLLVMLKQRLAGAVRAYSGPDSEAVRAAYEAWSGKQ